MRERDVVKEVLAALREEGAYAFKTHATASSHAGLPDVIACYAGRFYAFEVKAPGKEGSVTAIQMHNLEKVAVSGGMSAVVTSGEQAAAVIGVSKQMGMN